MKSLFLRIKSAASKYLWVFLTNPLEAIPTLTVTVVPVTALIAKVVPYAGSVVLG